MRFKRQSEQQRALIHKITEQSGLRVTQGQIASKQFGSGSSTYTVTMPNGDATGIGALVGDFSSGKSVMVAKLGERGNQTMILGQAPPHRRATESAVVWSFDMVGKEMM